MRLLGRSRSKGIFHTFDLFRAISKIYYWDNSAFRILYLPEKKSIIQMKKYSLKAFKELSKKSCRFMSQNSFVSFCKSTLAELIVQSDCCFVYFCSVSEWIYRSNGSERHHLYSVRSGSIKLEVSIFISPCCNNRVGRSGGSFCCREQWVADGDETSASPCTLLIHWKSIEWCHKKLSSSTRAR